MQCNTIIVYIRYSCTYFMFVHSKFHILLPMAIGMVYYMLYFWVHEFHYLSCWKQYWTDFAFVGLQIYAHAYTTTRQRSKEKVRERVRECESAKRKKKLRAQQTCWWNCYRNLLIFVCKYCVLCVYVLSLEHSIQCVQGKGINTKLVCYFSTKKACWMYWMEYGILYWRMHVFLYNIMFRIRGDTAQDVSVTCRNIGPGMI